MSDPSHRLGQHVKPLAGPPPWWQKLVGINGIAVLTMLFFLDVIYTWWMVIVIPLVALVLPIAMLLAAIAFDAAIVAWAIYRTVHDHPPHPGHWLHRPH